MASLSRKNQLQQVSWQVLEDLAFCSERYRRLAALAAYGVGIKVSADGGIEGFRRTTTVSEEGQVGTRMSFRLMK